MKEKLDYFSKEKVAKRRRMYRTARVILGIIGIIFTLAASAGFCYLLVYMLQSCSIVN